MTATDDALRAVERDANAVLQTRCRPCHAWSTAGLRQATSACDPAAALVVPFAAARSPLYAKVAGLPGCGGPMPPQGGLDGASRDALREWIDRGAPVARPAAPLTPPPPNADEERDWGPRSD